MTRNKFNRILIFVLLSLLVIYFGMNFVYEVDFSLNVTSVIVLVLLTLYLLAIMGTYIQNKFHNFENSLSPQSLVVFRTIVKTIELILTVAAGALFYKLYQDNNAQLFTAMSIYFPFVIYGIYEQQKNKLNLAD